MHQHVCLRRYTHTWMHLCIHAHGDQSDKRFLSLGRMRREMVKSRQLEKNGLVKGGFADQDRCCFTGTDRQSSAVGGQKGR